MVSDKDVNESVEFYNSLLEDAGSPYRVIYTARYGYKALDMGYRDREAHNGGMYKVIITGITRGQALQYINAMIEGAKYILWAQKWEAE